MSEKSCLYCTHLCYYSWPGNYEEPPTEDWDCPFFDEVQESVYGETDTMSIEEASAHVASHCSHYTPRTVACVRCNKPLGLEHELASGNWVMEAYTGEPIPACDDCLPIVKKEQDDLAKRLEMSLL